MFKMEASVKFSEVPFNLFPHSPLEILLLLLALFLYCFEVKGRAGDNWVLVLSRLGVFWES